MPAGTLPQAKRLAFILPVIVLIVAFTAIPLELEPLSRERLASAFHLYLDVEDVLSNIAGYVPVGIVLASQGTLWALGVATALSLFAEVSQLFSLGRAPSVIDVATNVIGAGIGLVLSLRWKTRWSIAPPQIRIDRRSACLAAALAAAYVGVGVLMTPSTVEEAYSSRVRPIPIRYARHRQRPMPKSPASSSPSVFWSASPARASGRPQRINGLASSSPLHLDCSCTEPGSLGCHRATVG